MKTVEVHNQTRRVQLAARAGHATGFFERGRGLLGKPAPGPGEGLVLEPCNSVHMFFMDYALDVIFADAELTVTACVPELRPWRMSPMVWGSRYAIELPVGSIAASGTQVGDRLSLGEPA
jgi:uncharacterized membrane protein (UPF0127 family)